jgi:hypothetical protein
MTFSFRHPWLVIFVYFHCGEDLRNEPWVGLQSLRDSEACFPVVHLALRSNGQGWVLIARVLRNFLRVENSLPFQIVLPF